MVPHVTSLMKFRVLTSLNVAVIYPSPWARQNLSALLKIEQTLSHRETRSIPVQLWASMLSRTSIESNAEIPTEITNLPIGKGYWFSW